MKYIVALVEYGEATHKWIYDYPSDAINQLKLLSEAYVEVNEVCPIFLKVGYSDVKKSLMEVVNQYAKKW